VNSVSSVNSFEYYRQALRSQMNEYADHISGGACKDYSEYSKCVGIIEGLAIAERELLDMQAKAEEDYSA
jgi:hypothetical protein